MIQDTIFEKSESDAWFLRNEKAIINRHANNDIIYRMICSNINKNKITSILDLGCSNGFRLNFFKSFGTYKKLSNLFYDTDNVTNTDIKSIAKGNLCICELLEKTLDKNYVEVS